MAVGGVQPYRLDKVIVVPPLSLTTIEQGTVLFCEVYTGKMSSTESSAQKAIKDNLGILNRVLNNESVFRQVAQKCVERRLITTEELAQLNDRFTGQTLQARVEAFVLRLAVLLGDLPENIDEFLCIIHDIDSLIAEKAAKDIAQSCVKRTFRMYRYFNLSSLCLYFEIGGLNNLPKYAATINDSDYGLSTGAKVAPSSPGIGTLDNG